MNRHITVGYKGIIRFTLGSAGPYPPDMPKVYWNAEAAIGFYPICQFHAHINNEGSFGSYWKIGRGKYAIVIGCIHRSKRTVRDSYEWPLTIWPRIYFEERNR